MGFKVACAWVMLELNHVTSLRWDPFPFTDLITGAIQHVQELRSHTLARVGDGSVGLGRQEELKEVSMEG